MNKEDLYSARFLHNFLIGIVSGEVLSLVFGTVNPQFGFRFALLYCLIISPYLLYLYDRERDALIKKYGWRKGRGAALRLLFSRYSTAGVAATAATVEKYFGENIPLLLLLGFIWAVIYAKVLADANYPEVPHYWVMKLMGRADPDYILNILNHE
ncbi:MAG TPA: hypothetical protein EYH13_00085 [Thermococcus paralvinellae]|uniref:Uncharacterized protein n=1 Tax=Thermococcus paralvinellae TaxID=582419 RepID=A0A833DYL6_9EURY|nr:hypothetical protein [Thermococcus paralvinellae]